VQDVHPLKGVSIDRELKERTRAEGFR